MEQMVMEPIDDARWETVRARERDDRFVFAVRTTSIYCRPGCPSRTPARRNVVAFGDAAAATHAGFRACKRCAPDDVTADADRVRLIRRACALLDADTAPALDAVAREVGLSRFHFQRVFRRVAGVTPGEYLRARRGERFRTRLASGATVTAAIQDAGYGSSSRPYADDPLGMTPTRYRAGGRGERVSYAIAPCSLGRVLAATTDRGVCAIELGDDD
ncbi:MAG TPA: Ada metal-binding domain-containing protein, partial [Xanthomonadales bacterium]|nr:Ada metal-binding domain-containing protein [Xanthomonadales bacterium]